MILCSSVETEKIVIIYVYNAFSFKNWSYFINKPLQKHLVSLVVGDNTGKLYLAYSIML